MHFTLASAIELAHVRREGGQLAVATFDIDYFKRINDEWGHETGDRVLAHIGQLLSAGCREIDIAARVGGEEFAVMLPDSDSADAYAFTQRIRTALATSRSGLPAVRISAGVVSSDIPARIEQLVQRADSALYEAKRTGRDRTTIGSID